MADRKWKCIGACGREFGIGDWECSPGIKHQVEPKEYYDLDAPQDPTGHMLRNSRHRIENVPPEISVKNEHGELQKVAGGWVEFVRGLLVCDDPEKQYWLERQGYGTATKEQWRQRWFTTDEKQQMREIEITRKERELNDLLEKAKAQTARATTRKVEANVAV